MTKLTMHMPAKRSVRKIIIILFISGFALNTYSADSLKFINDLNLSLRINHGFICPHHSAIRFLLNERITGFEMCVSTQTYGKTVYDKLFHYPRLGVGYLYTSLGNDRIFGKAHALFCLMDFEILGQQKKVSLNYEIDFGIGYLTRQFDPENNLLNIAISKPLNFFGGLNFRSYYHINSRQEINAGIKLFHFSNGKTGTPNLGLNSLVFSIGYNYRIRPYLNNRLETGNEEKIKKNLFDITLAAGTKADDQVTNKYYFTSSFVIDYKYRLNLKYALGAGMDLFFDEALGPNKTADLGEPYSNSDLYQVGIHGAVYSRFSRLTLMLQVGDYLYATYCKYASFYSRIGFRYNIYRHFSINLSLKSHYAIADFVEWGLTYSL